MNVAVLDSEAEEFYDEVKRSAEAGIDGLIVQDPGGLLIARAAVPDMPLHGSTQMTFHTPLGAEFAKKLGICRIVPARELTLDEIRKICETGMETEVFVHGAQCMCLSGQCYIVRSYRLQKRQQGTVRTGVQAAFFGCRKACGGICTVAEGYVPCAAR